MTDTGNVLIIDSDEDVIKFYKKSFFEFDPSYKTHVVSSCEEAIRGKTAHYVFVIIDIQVATKRHNRVLSISDKVELIQRFFRRSKIIVSIPYGSNYTIYQALSEFTPDALVIKEDLILRNFRACINSVLNATPYYSKTVLKFISLTYCNKFNLDSIDLILLHELNIGTRMKDIPPKVKISLSALEKRKILIKQKFGLSGRADRLLIKSAKKYGII